MTTTEVPRIGKDVIESLTLGMYEDCRFIYREYIQNSADQVDKAVAEGLLKPGEDGIYITIDKDGKRIVVEDNATGISQNDVLPILRNIAHSTKKRGEDKGFRGIGRLGGLGYCSKLTFETSFQGEDVCSVMVWDAELLKRIINDRKKSEEAVDVIERVTSSNVKREDASKHYFKVILEEVTSEELLDAERVKDYLSMVAPVDISNNFMFRSEINAFVAKHGLKVDVYNIYINGEQIYKPYTNKIYEDSHGGKKEVDDIFDVDFLLSKDNDGNVIYWGWYSLSRLKGQMKQKNLARGIRLRKENIQIGDEEICKKFFDKTADQRFSFYYFGEIHAVSKDLIPNSRRDYFGENSFLPEFERRVRHDFQKLRDMCYDASKIKSQQKDIAKRNEIANKIKEKEKIGYSSNEEKRELIEQLKTYQRKSDDAIKKLENTRRKLEESKSPLTSIVPKLIQTVVSEPPVDDEDDNIVGTPPKKTVFRTDNPIYSRFSKAERKLIGRIYASISRALPDEKQREAIIQVIEEDLTK